MTLPASWFELLIWGGLAGAAAGGLGLTIALVREWLRRSLW